MADTILTPGEALDAINKLRSNMVATQSASWSNMCYPLVAILDAAGYEVDCDVSETDMAEHLDTYGGAGGWPGRTKDPPSIGARNKARNIIREKQRRRERDESTTA